MGASYESVGQFIRKNILQMTLAKDQAYREFSRGLSERLNFYLWSSPGRSLSFFKDVFTPDLYQRIENQLSDLQNIESFGWQIGVEKGLVYNMARLKYNPSVQKSPSPFVWKSHLGNNVINRPKYVINQTDKAHPEIVVQDGDFNFILINSEGRVLWKIRLKGPIRSEVFQINCLRDGKLQYLFSTDTELHLIDHGGNYLRNFPLPLKSAATNGVSVAQYERNGDYRFFIACKDHKIYLFDQKGNVVPGWVPPKTKHDVMQPVQFFRTENKDYIVFTDQSQGYILDRKGNTRIAIKGDIAYSHNPFTLDAGNGKRLAKLVTTDIKGNIISVGLDGSVKRISTGNFSSEHYFFYDDFNLDNKRESIFFDGDSLVVYDRSANRILAKKFSHKISSRPDLVTFPDNSRKFGITDTTENRVYLYNTNGSICDGFPLVGKSRFSIGFPGNEKDHFNLITGTSGGYLINYLVK
jgi:outer membrane lipoprotein-sorting protein